jgi:hypothetical protein
MKPGDFFWKKIGSDIEMKRSYCFADEGFTSGKAGN